MQPGLYWSSPRRCFSSSLLTSRDASPQLAGRGEAPLSTAVPTCWGRPPARLQLHAVPTHPGTEQLSQYPLAQPPEVHARGRQFRKGRGRENMLKTSLPTLSCPAMWEGSRREGKILEHAFSPCFPTSRLFAEAGS